MSFLLVTPWWVFKPNIVWSPNLFAFIWTQDVESVYPMQSFWETSTAGQTHPFALTMLDIFVMHVMHACESCIINLKRGTNYSITIRKNNNNNDNMLHYKEQMLLYLLADHFQIARFYTFSEKWTQLHWMIMNTNESVLML